MYKLSSRRTKIKRRYFSFLREQNNNKKKKNNVKDLEKQRVKERRDKYKMRPRSDVTKWHGD